ncbi:hypothetical protein DFQ28_007485 [Apophysomyces sp. BC1034]|nr:hypothetical protein DFQ29_002748 [Apophysomyces sp. BC1021]KAG0186661.1 hypothetical protein DFQ28_007485 [Apophysomyces sp. BC1034]
MLRVIGKGAFGKVRILKHKATKIDYALKYISKGKCVELKAANNIIAERKLLEHIDYPLVVNLRYAFQDDENLFMVLDLMLGGDLRFHLERNGPLTELQVRFYVADIALSLGYLHHSSRRIAHRDIKPDNILLDTKGHAHLSDFNVACQFYDKKPLRWSRAGSLAYMAPEILAKQGYTTAVDWWSLGICPFKGVTTDTVIDAIVNQPLIFPDGAQNKVSQECLDLISKSPLQRLGCGPDGFEQFKEHPWFRGMDWGALERKEATPPFKPSSQESNFDAVHELEELLFEDAPLRPRKRGGRKSWNGVESDESRERQLLEDKFLPFDFTIKPSPKYHTSQLRRGSSAASTAVESRLFKRIGVLSEQYDQSKYRAQGYILTPDDDKIDPIATKVSKDV